MRSALVVKKKVAPQAPAGIGHRVIGMQIHFFILDALPEAFDKDIVAPGAFAVHADLDTVLLHQVDKGSAGELAARSELW